MSGSTKTDLRTSSATTRWCFIEALDDNKVFDFYAQAGFIGVQGTYELWMQMDTARGALA